MKEFHFVDLDVPLEDLKKRLLEIEQDSEGATEVRETTPKRFLRDPFARDEIDAGVADRRYAAIRDLIDRIID